MGSLPQAGGVAVSRQTSVLKNPDSDQGREAKSGCAVRDVGTPRRNRLDLAVEVARWS